LYKNNNNSLERFGNVSGKLKNLKCFGEMFVIVWEKARTYSAYLGSEKVGLEQPGLFSVLFYLQHFTVDK